MTELILLQELKKFTEDAVEDILLPFCSQNDFDFLGEKAADVYIHCFPSSEDSKIKLKAPIIVHQILTTETLQQPSSKITQKVTVRTSFCVFDKKRENGQIALLNLSSRLRNEIIKKNIIGKQFSIDLSQKIQILYYQEDTAPYFLGEMITVWNIPSIQREVNL